MPFIKSPNPPPENPFLTIEYLGLQVLHPANNSSSCEVGLHRNAPGHRLRIDLLVIPPGMLPTAEPLHEDVLVGSNFSIRVEPSAGVTAYKPTDDFQRDQDNDPQDLQWAINLGELHQGAKLDDGKSKPGLEVFDGIFYTFHKTNKNRVRVELEDINGIRTDLVSIASVIGTAIQPPAGNNVLIQWRVGGQDRSLTLPRDFDEPGTIFVLIVNNGPTPAAPNEHDELEHYYDLIKKNNRPVPPEERLKLIATPLTKAELTDEIPCMSTTLEP